jgi:site-specific recombinase XerC
MGVTHFDDKLDEVVCSKFIHSKVDKLRDPATSTMHLRRSALRAGLTTLRRLGNFEGDPTLDILLPPRSQLAARMATDDEMVLLRMNSVASRASRQPAVLALAGTTATTSELPAIAIGAVDDPANPRMVSLPGGKGVRPRTNPLSPWGSKVIRAFITERLTQGATESDPLIYFGLKPGDASPQASVCRALQSIFQRAGLNAEPDLVPRSIGFWAGHEAFEAAPQKKLEVAANTMGIRSLDKAAMRIDYSWEEA